MGYLSAASEWANSLPGECWSWFMGLNQQEWFVVLGIGAAIGFFCMRGFGSKYRV